MDIFLFINPVYSPDCEKKAYHPEGSQPSVYLSRKNEADLNMQHSYLLMYSIKYLFYIAVNIVHLVLWNLLHHSGKLWWLIPALSCWASSCLIYLVSAEPIVSELNTTSHLTFRRCDLAYWIWRSPVAKLVNMESLFASYHSSMGCKFKRMQVRLSYKPNWITNIIESYNTMKGP